MAINEQTRQRILDFAKTDKFKSLSPEQQAPFKTALMGTIKPESAPVSTDVFDLDLPPEVAAKRPYLEATQKTLKEGLAIPALNFLDMASLGTVSGTARKFGKEIPKPETLPGKILAGGAGIYGLAKTPILRGISALKIPGLSKLGRVPEGAITGAVKGATAGGLFSPKDITDVKQRLKQAGVGGVLGGVIGGVGGLFQQALASRPEKVNQIRKGMREYWKRTSNKYGQLLKQAGKEGGSADPIETLEFMEKELVKRGVLDRSTFQKIAPPQDKVERAFFKAYENLKKEYIESGGGKVPVASLIKGSRTVAAAGRKARFRPSTMGVEARDLERGIQDTFKSNLRREGKSFQEAQELWAKFRERFDLVDDKFRVWESGLRTGRGEQSLAKIFTSGELRSTANIIEQETGINLTNEKILSVLMAPATREAIRTAGFLGGIYLIAKRIGQGGESSTETIRE